MNRLNLNLALLLAGIAPALAGADDTTATAPVAAAALRPYEAVYDFHYKGISAGTSSITLRQEASGDWVYTSQGRPNFLASLVYPSAARIVSSRMSVDQGGVRPLLITDTRNGERAPQSAVHFDWAVNRATGNVEDQAIDMELRPGVQDDQSVQVALMQALNAGQAPTGFSMFDKNGIRDYSNMRVGEETLATPLGAVATIIYRSQKSNASRSTRFWCAPAYAYIPMRVEQRRLDKVEWTMDIRSLQRH